MPTYDYVCDACSHAFEHFQSMTSKVLRTCPECGKRKLRRLIGSGAGVIFKGGGFYETDYKRKASGDAAKKSEKGEKGEKATQDASSTGSDPKPSAARDPGSKSGDSASRGGAGSTAKKAAGDD